MVTHEGRMGVGTSHIFIRGSHCVFAVVRRLMKRNKRGFDSPNFRLRGERRTRGTRLMGGGRNVEVSKRFRDLLSRAMQTPAQWAISRTNVTRRERELV